MFRLNLVLLTVVILCALSVVTTQHKARKLFIEMESEKQITQDLGVEWGRLQLEQSTWAMHQRIEKVASTHLNMQMPDNKHTRVVFPAPASAAVARAASLAAARSASQAAAGKKP